jgi:hypothetical protein
MSKKQLSQVLGYIQATQGERLTWALKLKFRGSVRILCAVPSPDIEAHTQSNNSFELKIGRDFLIAINALVFELTKSPVKATEMRLWIDRLCTADPAYGMKAKNSLASQATYEINDPPGLLPILYRNRRILIVDARASLGFSYGRQLVLIDHVLNIEAGTADWHPSGEYDGFVIYGPHELSVSGKTLSELAANCLDKYVWTLNN